MAKKFNSQQEHDAYVEEKQKNRTIWGVIMASSLGLSLIHIQMCIRDSTTYKVFKQNELIEFMQNEENIKGSGLIITEFGDKYMMIKWERFKKQLGVGSPKMEDGRWKIQVEQLN